MNSVLPCSIVAAGRKALAERLGIEIHRNEDHVIGQWVDDFLQSLQLCFLCSRMIDFERPCILDSLDAVRERIEPGTSDAP
jgi:hypothetical protein